MLLLTSSVLALSIASAPIAPGSPSPEGVTDRAPSEARTAEAFMMKVLARYSEAKTYRHDGVQRMEMELEGDDSPMPEMPVTKTGFWYEGPGSFALTGGELVEVYTKGGSLTAYAPLVSKYAVSEASTERPTLKDLPGMFGMFLPQQHAIESIVLEKPGTFAQTQLMIKSWDTLKESVYEGEPGHLVGCTIGGMMGMPALPGLFWVDAESGLIGMYEIDMTEMMKSMNQPGMPTPSSVKQIFEFRNIALNTPIDADAFTFEPGEDDVRVETLPSLEEIIEEGYGMSMDGGGNQAGPELGTEAPAFTATTLGGEQITLSDLKGKVVLIDFWATWCGPCVQAMPTIQALHDTYADQGLVVIGVSLDNPNAGTTIKTFINDKGITFTQIHDKNSSIAQKFGVSPIPNSIIIGKDGTVQANHVGFMPGMEKQYAEEIEALLKGNALVDG